jgi:hypothetical protein
MHLSVPSLKVIQFNSVLYYLSAVTTVIRPVTQIAQGLEEMTNNKPKHIEKR